MDARRVRRRRGVLRRLGLPDHRPAPRRARPQPAHQPPAVLAAPSAPAAPGAVHDADGDGGVGDDRRHRRRARPAAPRPAVGDLLRRQLGPDHRRRAVLVRRSTAAASPVEPRRGRAVVPAVAAVVRGAEHPAAAPPRRRGGARGGVARGDDRHVLAARQRPGADPLRHRCVRRRRSHQLHVPGHLHPLCRLAPRGGGGARVAAVAMVTRRPPPGHERAAARRRRGRRGRRPVRHRLLGEHPRRLRVPVAARPGLDPVARGRAHRRAPGRIVAPRRPVVAAAGGDRPPQLRALPLELADLRHPRGHPRLGAAGDGGPRRHRGRLGGVLSVRRAAGPSRRTRTVVAALTPAPAPDPAGVGHRGRGRHRRLLRHRRAVQPSARRCRRLVLAADEHGGHRDDDRRRGDARRGSSHHDIGGRRRAAADRRRRRFHRLCPGAQRARRDRRHVRHHRRVDRGMQRLRRRLDAELQRRPRPLLRSGAIAGSTSGPMPRPRAGRRSPSWCSARGTCSTSRTATATT